MAATLRVVRVALHILAVIIILVGMTFGIVSLLTSGWQMYHNTAGGINEIQQHGLWFDYTYSSKTLGTDLSHIPENPEWQWRYKFGPSAWGDESHRWRPYQYDTLILIAVAVFLAFVSVCLSYAASYSVVAAVVLAFTSLFPPILGMIAVITFFMSSILPDNNHVYRNTWRITLDVGYSFYLAIVATIAFGLGFLCTVAAVAFDIIISRQGDRPLGRPQTRPNFNANVNRAQQQQQRQQNLQPADPYFQSEKQKQFGNGNGNGTTYVVEKHSPTRSGNSFGLLHNTRV